MSSEFIFEEGTSRYIGSRAEGSRREMTVRMKDIVAS
jgi:hypothetical protein